MGWRRNRVEKSTFDYSRVEKSYSRAEKGTVD